MNLHWWLKQYKILGEDILLCYRPTLKSWWGDRCLFSSEEYDKNKDYNHRSILTNEIVIEFDEDSKEVNKKYADIVCNRLKDDNIHYAKWYSGNKSTHVHCIMEIGNVANKQLFKKVFMRHYCEGLPLPDLRLACSNHLIRAEYGVHEKTGNKKSLISRTIDYPLTSKVKQEIWEKYIKEYNIILKRKVTTDVNKLDEHPAMKYILSSEKFRGAGDGHERALFMLIHVLKKNYNDKKELARFLWDWYRYSGGYQLSEEQVNRKISYHWNRNYNFGERYLSELLESIGVDINDIK